MSVHKRGGRWVTRWEDEHAINPKTGKPQQRSKSWPTQKLANAHDRKIKNAKDEGEFAYLEKGATRLADFVEERWLLDWAEGNLSPKTLKDYKGLWNREIKPRIGRLPLKEIDPEVIESWQADMDRQKVSRPTAWRARITLDSILTRAVTWKYLTHHPGAYVRRPKMAKPDPVRPWTPEKVEAVRAALLRDGQLMWATFVSVMAYAGLRPNEAWTLKWSDVGKNVISFRATKTGNPRTIPITRALARDLARWRLVSEQSDDADLIFFGERTGEELRDGSKNNWWGKVWPNALKAAKVKRDRPYVLRHSIVSLWIAEGHKLGEVARRAGHTQRTMLDTYSHIFDEFETSENQDAEALIAAARGQWTDSGLPISFPATAAKAAQAL